MEMGFWGKLPKPFLAQAPMLDVTDAAFRQIIAKYGKPDVMWTEFVSADGLYSRGREKLLPMLRFTDAERPIVAQLFSADPAKMREASALVAELGFDGVDINMGCPDKNVMKQGSGAALIRDAKRAREIIRAAWEGVEGKIPVSVKTRTGDRSDDELDQWVPELLSEEPAALTVHARTRADMSKVPARWEAVRRAVALRDASGLKTLIIGNGDVADVPAALARAEETGCDGVMIGRGIFGNPWVFRRDGYQPTTEEKLRVLAEHAALFEELLGVRKFEVMKKHVKAYVSEFEGAADIRAELMECNNSRMVSATIDKYIEKGV
jgi:nifR3 family TIM-barrel protein